MAEKVTHAERLVAWFKVRRNIATLREIMHSDEPWSYEFRARLCDARDKGLISGWECDRTLAAKTGHVSDHLYKVFPLVTASIEAGGQQVFA